MSRKSIGCSSPVRKSRRKVQSFFLVSAEHVPFFKHNSRCSPVCVWKKDIVLSGMGRASKSSGEAIINPANIFAEVSSKLRRSSSCKFLWSVMSLLKAGHLGRKKLIKKSITQSLISCIDIFIKVDRTAFVNPGGLISYMDRDRIG